MEENLTQGRESAERQEGKQAREKNALEGKEKRSKQKSVWFLCQGEALQMVTGKKTGKEKGQRRKRRKPHFYGGSGSASEGNLKVTGKGGPSRENSGERRISTIQRGGWANMKDPKWRFDECRLITSETKAGKRQTSGPARRKEDYRKGLKEWGERPAPVWLHSHARVLQFCGKNYCWGVARIRGTKGRKLDFSLKSEGSKKKKT